MVLLVDSFLGYSAIQIVDGFIQRSRYSKCDNSFDYSKIYISKRVEFSKMNRVVLSSGTRQLLNKPVQTLARPVLVTQTRTYISLLPNWEDNTPVAPHQWGTKFVVSSVTVKKINTIILLLAFHDQTSRNWMALGSICLYHCQILLDVHWSSIEPWIDLQEWSLFG